MSLIFITLSTTGYIKYTLNCLESVKRIGLEQPLHSYVIGKEGYDIIKAKGYPCTLIDDKENSNYQVFRKGNWSDIVFYKFQIVYENLLKYDYVCLTDGDIVFENKDFLKYLKDNIGEHDMLVQREGVDEGMDFCSGFMYIKSTELTRSIFNPTNVLPYKQPSNWGDQAYLNLIVKKMKLNYKKLPIALFPTGRYYYTHSDLSPYIIHFNWAVGEEKHTLMNKYGKWYI
jgi:hypothetical protein